MFFSYLKRFYLCFCPLNFICNLLEFLGSIRCYFFWKSRDLTVHKCFCIIVFETVWYIVRCFAFHRSFCFQLVSYSFTCITHVFGLLNPSFLVFVWLRLTLLFSCFLCALLSFVQFWFCLLLLLSYLLFPRKCHFFFRFFSCSRVVDRGTRFFFSVVWCEADII